MRFLLDTCVLSDFAQGQRQTLERIKAAAPEDLAASAITQMEIEYGLLLNSKIARRLGPVMDAFFGTIRVLPYDEGAAEATAKARAILKRRGTANWSVRYFDRGDRSCPRPDRGHLELSRVQAGRGAQGRRLAVMKRAKRRSEP
jgi:predicted nucleic acid-binding protein